MGCNLYSGDQRGAEERDKQDWETRYQIPGCCRSPVQVGRTLPLSFYENNHAISDCSVSFVTIYRDLITYLKHPDLADHGLSVYLTHVVARVIPLHVPDVQLPSIDPVV